MPSTARPAGPATAAHGVMRPRASSSRLVRRSEAHESPKGPVRGCYHWQLGRFRRRSMTIQRWVSVKRLIRLSSGVSRGVMAGGLAMALAGAVVATPAQAQGAAALRIAYVNYGEL